MCSSPKPSITLHRPSPLAAATLLDADFHQNFRTSNDNVERLQQQRLRAFELQQPEFHQTIEIEQLRSPGHILQMKQALASLALHQRLKISSHSATVIQDLEACARILQLHCQRLAFRRRHFLYVSETG